MCFAFVVIILVYGCTLHPTPNTIICTHCRHKLVCGNITHSREEILRHYSLRGDALSCEINLELRRIDNHTMTMHAGQIH